MAQRFVLLLVALTWAAAADARHSSTTLDPRRATPGVDLELVQAARSATGDTVKYRLRVKGLPAGHSFGVWTKTFGRDFSEVVPEFRNGIELDLGSYPRGAAWWVAIAWDSPAAAPGSRCRRSAFSRKALIATRATRCISGTSSSCSASR